jgi:hypothetical protein
MARVDDFEDNEPEDEELEENEPDDLADELESLVDSSSLRRVLEALAAVCYAKADHLRSNWQDYASARVWGKAAKVVEAASMKVDV